MGVLLDTVAHAFCPGGPVEQIKGQHRSMQETFARNLAATCERSADHPATPAMIQETMAGIGKTLVGGVVLGLHVLLDERRSIIATFSRALRSEYLLELPLIDRIIRQTLEETGNAGLYRPVTMAEYVSITEFISPTKIEVLSARPVLDAESSALIAYTEACQETGRPAEFSDYYAYGNDGNPAALPDGMTELDLAMGSSDRLHPIAEKIRSDNITAISADIILITHSMLIINNTLAGSARQDNFEDDLQARNGLVFIDEADKIAGLAAATVESTLSDDVLNDFLADASARFSNAEERSSKIFATAEQLIQTGFDLLWQFYADSTPDRGKPLVLNVASIALPDLLNAVTKLDDGFRMIRYLASGKQAQVDQDIFLFSQASRLRQEIGLFQNVSRFNNPKLQFTLTNINNMPVRRVMLSLGQGRNLIHRLWRPQPHKPRSFMGVALVSATLADLPPNQNSYYRFMRDVGFDAGEQDILFYYPPLRRSRADPWGTISNIAVIHRDHVLRPTDVNQPDFIDPLYVEQAVIGIKAAINRLRKRPVDRKMLILTPSYSFGGRLYDDLPDQDRIILRRRNLNVRADLERFAATPHGVWIGVEWEGVNFVDPVTLRTMISSLVISRLPMPPRNPIRADRRKDGFGNRPDNASLGQFSELRDGVLTAFHKLSQGFGRGIRNQSDEIDECLILDQRFPVPIEIASSSRSIARRNQADLTGLFQHFDQTVVGRYEIINWSKMLPDGELVSLT